MAWCPDLSVAFELDCVRHVGWLEADHPFTTGPVDSAVYDKLETLLRNPWQPYISGGMHECSLCAYRGAKGTKNLFVPGETYVYYCPELITHYMNAHGYRPPDGFCSAVLACPEMRSMAYFKSLVSVAKSLLEAFDLSPDSQ